MSNTKLGTRDLVEDRTQSLTSFSLQPPEKETIEQMPLLKRAGHNGTSWQGVEVRGRHVSLNPGSDVLIVRSVWKLRRLPVGHGASHIRGMCPVVASSMTGVTKDYKTRHWVRTGHTWRSIPILVISENCGANLLRVIAYALTEHLALMVSLTWAARMRGARLHRASDRSVCCAPTSMGSEGLSGCLSFLHHSTGNMIAPTLQPFCDN